MTAPKKTSLSILQKTREAIDRFPSRHHGNDVTSWKLEELLEDYFSLLAREQKTVLPRFTLAEINYLRDGLNSTLLTLEFSRGESLAWQVGEMDKYEGLGEKWNVDVPALQEKLKSLNDWQAYSLVKSIDRFWSLSDKDRGKEMQDNGE